MKGFLAFTIIVLGTLGSYAQTDSSFKEVAFLTQDSLRISASYKYPELKGQKVPAVILIHQGRSSRKEWLALPITNKLIQEGYAVLVYDIRLHGTSQSDGEFSDLYNNPKRAPYDLQAAIGFLQQDALIDAQRIGVMGASIGGNLASVSASSKSYGVKSVISLSAKVSAVQNLSGRKKKLSFKNAFYIASEGEQDGKRAAWAKDLFRLTSGERKVVIAKGNKHGSFILKENPSMDKDILAWFKLTL